MSTDEFRTAEVKTASTFIIRYSAVLRFKKLKSDGLSAPLRGPNHKAFGSAGGYLLLGLAPKLFGIMLLCTRGKKKMGRSRDRRAGDG